MTLKLNGTNSEAAPAYAGDDADTGLQCGTNELKLVTGGSARATVDSSGRLLVGTSSTSATCTSVFAGRSDGATDPVLRLEVNSTSPANGTALGGLNFASSGLSAFQAGARIAAVRDGGTWTNGSSHPTYLEFATTADGASSPTERMRILSSGGITFNGDTAATNALDDYEEGTWTPQAFNNANGASTNSTSNRAAKYIKVGRLVHICCYILVNKGSNTGNFEINNLPYPTDTNSDLHSGISVGYFDGLNTTISMMLATAQPNSSKLLMRMISGTGAGSIATLRGTHLNSTMNVIVGGTYIASS